MADLNAVLFFVEDLNPMVWNDGAFDHLVYDEQQKDLVLAFVENHASTAPMLGDVIKGKGEGLIVLLSGPPGTGKTLTAEAGMCPTFPFLSRMTTRIAYEFLRSDALQWPTERNARWYISKPKISVSTR